METNSSLDAVLNSMNNSIDVVLSDLLPNNINLTNSDGALNNNIKFSFVVVLKENVSNFSA